MPVMNSSQFNYSTIDISKNIKIMAVAEVKTFDKEWKQIINKEGTDLKIEKMMGYEGIGAAPEKSEGADAVQGRIYEGNIETILQATYAYELPVTWEQRRFVVKDAKFLAQLGQYLSRSMGLRYEYTSANVLNNGFTAGATAGGDTFAYFSASHTWTSGGTYDNLLTAADMTKTTLKAGIVEMSQATMEKSIPASLKIKQVIIPTGYIFDLPEILKSTLDPDTANNRYNALQDYAITKTINHYLSDADAWFMDSQVNTRTLYEADAPFFDDYLDNRPNNLVERATTSIGAGFHHQTASFGNLGA